MWEFLKKKKMAPLPNPSNGNEDEEQIDVEAPDANAAVDKIDAALKAADQLKAQKEQEEFEKAEREARRNSGSRCGCGW